MKKTRHLFALLMVLTCVVFSGTSAYATNTQNDAISDAMDTVENMESALDNLKEEQAAEKESQIHTEDEIRAMVEGASRYLEAAKEEEERAERQQEMLIKGISAAAVAFVAGLIAKEGKKRGKKADAKTDVKADIKPETKTETKNVFDIDP